MKTMYQRPVVRMALRGCEVALDKWEIPFETGPVQLEMGDSRC